MKLPSVYPLTIPSSHSTIRMIAIVSSMVLSSRARLGDAFNDVIFQQPLCRISTARQSTVERALILVLFLIVTATSPLGAQNTDPAQPTNPASTQKQFLPFVAGAATGFAAHEMGHVIVDLAFGETPGLKKVDFHGLPFFAITHRSGRPSNEEFIISSAGFWMQQAGNEWLLTKRPQLKSEHAPFAKGYLAFNVLASVVYSGAAFAKTGPVERDTRGMAASSGTDERWIGAIVLTPAVLDAWRYYHPNSKWAIWTSRGVKIGMVLMVVR
jgi:hypothetical protein